MLTIHLYTYGISFIHPSVYILLFLSINNLSKVKGIGAKVYEQCAGFIRILPSSQHQQQSAAGKQLPTAAKQRSAAAKSVKAKSSSASVVNPLDATSIHPESYRCSSCIYKAHQVVLSASYHIHLFRILPYSHYLSILTCQFSILSESFFLNHDYLFVDQVKM